MTPGDSSESSKQDTSGEDLRRDYPVTLSDGREAVLSVVLTHEGIVTDLFYGGEPLYTFTGNWDEYVRVVMEM